MSKYILVYQLAGYPETGGGTYFEEFGDEENNLHKRVEALVKLNKDDITIITAGFLQVEYRYKTIEYAVRVEPERI